MQTKIYLEIITNTPKETEILGYNLGKALISQKRNFPTEKQYKTIILLQGSLGCGKTIFTKGFVKSFDILQNVCSPTFIICKTYKNKLHTIYHLDLYLASLEPEFLEELLEEITYKDFCIVEYPQNCSNFFPDFAFLVEMQFLNESQRKITIYQNQYLDNKNK
jgi:tRNA threonylcarbamoyladenosine biosynthesis protein TsaE